MSTINWGILSTGNIANSFATDFQHSQGGKILAVASRSQEKATKFCEKHQIDRAYGSYQELLNDSDVDAIYIATPHNFHYQNTADALAQGKAVLCEKPITINPSECQKLIHISSSTNTYLMEALWTYFLPPIIKAMNWIKEGRIGMVKNLKADFGFKAPFNPENRLFNPALAGGALLDIGIYPIALSWLIYRKFPTNMLVTVEKSTTQVDQQETLVFEYEDGAIANITSSILYKMPNEALIIGEYGYIRIPEFFMAKECYLFNGNDQQIEHFKDTRKSTGYNYEIDAVHHDLQRKLTQSAIVPLATSLKIQELMAMVKKEF